MLRFPRHLGHGLHQEIVRVWGWRLVDNFYWMQSNRLLPRAAVDDSDTVDIDDTGFFIRIDARIDLPVHYSRAVTPTHWMRLLLRVPELSEQRES